MPKGLKLQHKLPFTGRGAGGGGGKRVISAWGKAQNALERCIFIMQEACEGARCWMGLGKQWWEGWIEGACVVMAVLSASTYTHYSY